MTVSEYIRRLVVTDVAVANLINSDKLQTHGLNIHIPPSENGGFLSGGDEADLLQSTMNAVRFSARPDVNQWLPVV